MIGSFVNSNKVAWRFNREGFVKQSLKLVPSVKLLFLKFCYQDVYMEMEISCLTRTGPGTKTCFCLYGIFIGNVSSI